MNITDQLKEYFYNTAGELTGIRCIWLFGSLARGTVRKDSDMDIAFLVDEKQYEKDPFLAVSPAYMAAMRAGIRFDRQTDVTILNSSSLEIAYEVVTEGVCVYAGDQEERFEYETRIRGMYLDFKPFLMQLRRKRLHRQLSHSV
jgi:predicted nucleotidyltransferase